MLSGPLANHPEPCVPGLCEMLGAWLGHTRTTQASFRISPCSAQLELHVEKQTRSPGSSLPVRSWAHLIHLALRFPPVLPQSGTWNHPGFPLPHPHRNTPPTLLILSLKGTHFSSSYGSHPSQKQQRLSGGDSTASNRSHCRLLYPTGQGRPSQVGE